MAKNQYIGVDNVARHVKQPYIGVSNVSRKVKNGFVGVNGVARQFFQGGTPISALSIGSSVYLNEDGSPVEYIVVNQGIPSGSSLYDSSCNGTWLLRKYLYGDAQQWDYMHSSGATNYTYNILENSYIYNWLNSTMLSKYDAYVQNYIKQVKIPYRSGGGLGTDQSGTNGLSCKIFLLSGFEVGFTNNDFYYYPSDGFPNDGAVLSYFNGASNEKRKASNESGTYLDWWLRSPRISDSGSVWEVRKTGAYSSNPSNSLYYIRPTLVMPFHAVVDDNMNMIQ